MRPIVRGRLAGFLATLVCLAMAGEATAVTTGVTPIDLEIRQIDTFLPSLPDQRFGSLEYRGGLELRSSDRRFGSLSGLDFAANGTLYAVSDRGRWFTARPIVDNGWLIGLADAGTAPILNNAGVPLAGKTWGDGRGPAPDRRR